jgi:hypothetical protein
MSKVDTIIEKYRGVIQTRTINSLNAGDTTPTKKYLEYMCKAWLQTRNAREVIRIVMLFDELLPYIKNKDIYHSYYSTTKNLYEVVEKSLEIREEKTFIKDEHVDILIENDDYILLIPKTIRGSIKYGKGTKWCTSAKNGQYFSSYVKSGYLVYLLRKKKLSDIWDSVAFYTKRTNVLCGNIEVFTSNDSSKSSGDIYRSSWNINEMLYIMSYIRNYITYLEYRGHIKEDTKKIVDQLKMINIEKLVEYKKILGDDDSNMFNEINQRLTTIMDVLENN